MCAIAPRASRVELTMVSGPCKSQHLLSRVLYDREVAFNLISVECLAQPAYNSPRARSRTPGFCIPRS